MDNTLFPQFATAIRNIDLNKVRDASIIPADFLLAKDGLLTSHYIPFDSVNKHAKIVLVGITPGFTQWTNAVREAQRQLLEGSTEQDALVAAKRTGAFSGAMRPNLIALLDQIGLHRWLKIEGCATLFGSDSGLVQTTSILRHPIFIDGDNYNGTPSMIKTPFLQKQLVDHFAGEAAQLDNPVYIPLGPKVGEGLDWLVQQGVLKEDRILSGLPHPSGANAERIAYFLGRKQKSALSIKTNADKLDETRTALISRLMALA